MRLRGRIPQNSAAKGCNVWKGSGCRALSATRETAFAQRDRFGAQSRWNSSAGGAYHLARGWIMYCDGCGTQLTSGGQFCTKCGKPIVPGAVASSPGLGHAGAPAAGAAVSNGRVRRNLHRLAILWMINGMLRLMGIGWMMIFRQDVFPVYARLGRPGRVALWGQVGLGHSFYGQPLFAGRCSGVLRCPAPGSGVGAF